MRYKYSSMHYLQGWIRSYCMDEWSHLKSPASRLFTQSFIQVQIKEKHPRSASLAFVRGIHRCPVNSPHKWPETRKMFHLMTSSCSKTVLGRILRLFSHDDVIKWKHFPRYWPFVRGIHWSPVDSSHTGQWRGAFKSSLICGWTKGWANNRCAGDLILHCTHDDVMVRFSLREIRGVLFASRPGKWSKTWLYNHLEYSGWLRLTIECEPHRTIQTLVQVNNYDLDAIKAYRNLASHLNYTCIFRPRCQPSVQDYLTRGSAIGYLLGKPPNIATIFIML